MGTNVCSTYDSPDGAKTQGRAQLVLAFGGMTQRNCQLYSKVGGYSQSYYSTNMVPPSTAGYDCSYYSGYSFNGGEATLLHSTFAHNADTCCKACAATKGCTASSF